MSGVVCLSGWFALILFSVSLLTQSHSFLGGRGVRGDIGFLWGVYSLIASCYVILCYIVK